MAGMSTLTGINIGSTLLSSNHSIHPFASQTPSGLQKSSLSPSPSASASASAATSLVSSQRTPQKSFGVTGLNLGTLGNLGNLGNLGTLGGLSISGTGQPGSLTTMPTLSSFSVKTPLLNAVP